MKINKNEKKICNEKIICNKTENYDDIIFNNWKKKENIKENTNLIITKKNNYSVMSYSMWINVKNYLDKCSTNDLNNKKEEKLKKKNIKIYIFIIFNKINLPVKINILKKNISICKIILSNIINYFRFL
jgi:hypothetical protein